MVLKPAWIIPVVLLLMTYGTAEGITDYYMMNLCGRMLDISLADAARLRLTRSSQYHPEIDCQLVIQASPASPADHINVHFSSLDIKYDKNCSTDWLELHDGPLMSSPFLSNRKKYCGSSIPSGGLTTSSRYLTLRFKSGESVQGRGFDMVIAQYHTDVTQGNCRVPGHVVAKLIHLRIDFHYSSVSSLDESYMYHSNTDVISGFMNSGDALLQMTSSDGNKESSIPLIEVDHVLSTMQHPRHPS